MRIVLPGGAGLVGQNLIAKLKETNHFYEIIVIDKHRENLAKNWARLIQKIYEVDPLICPKCNGEMRIIAFIEQPLSIKKILKHLGIWDTHNHDPPQKPAEKIRQIVYDDTYSQVPPFDYWSL
jgi:UDP-glucose 4-epimerase